MHGATMDYRLRKGETFTRWWRPQGGRWSHQESDADNDWWKNLLHRAPYGAKSNHANFSIWTHGNGLFDYQPTLRKGLSARLDDSSRINRVDEALDQRPMSRVRRAGLRSVRVQAPSRHDRRDRFLEDASRADR